MEGNVLVNEKLCSSGKVDIIGQPSLCFPGLETLGSKILSVNTTGILPPWEDPLERETYAQLSWQTRENWGRRTLLYCGPSGSGKDESLDEYLAGQKYVPDDPFCCRLPMTTTRMLRPEEVDRVISSRTFSLDDTRYFFATKEEFLQMKELRLIIAWRKRETGEYYGLMHPIAKKIYEDPKAIAVITCGLRTSWLIKESLGGLPKIIFISAKDKVIRERYEASGRPKNEEKLRLKLRLYREWAPKIADYLIENTDQDLLAIDFGRIVTTVKQGL